ncbi:hypothetical protein SAMN05216359_11944 [Roseateles sp. YR242]|uniref:hypothetical protein n=1 Tax=Roseateles sp. YR242 TaxID=1855305 RepID=UPI0008D600DC|nr:hypothetical protein [Roseateles sp. YR242]SEL84473.1 hypothetical protein SAMN05216359_11944 [Roseateles sp. YR242]
MLAIIRRAGILRAFAAVVMTASLTGCANFYVDNATPEVPVSAYQKPAQPQPVQLFFEFQTKGVLNQQASAHLKARLADQVRGSGVFSEVSEGPVAGGASLSIVLNNVVLTDDAFSKGFATGLTLGLAGSQVGDGYICTATYRAPGATEPIVKKARHAIYTTMGATAGTPANGTKAASAEEAVTLMMRQVVSQVLNDVTHDTAFK